MSTAHQPLSFLSDFLSTHVLDEKIFVVPSYQIGHQIGESLAAQETAWANLRMMTLPALADEVAGVEIAAHGLKQNSGTASLFLMEQIFRELKRENRLTYFGALEAGTGIVRIILRALTRLRMEGINSTSLDPEDFVNSTKGWEVVLFMKRYEEKLKQTSAIDLPGLYGLALELLESGKTADDRFYLCFHDLGLSRMERSFLTKLAGERLIFVPRGEVYGLERPRRYWDVGEDHKTPGKRSKDKNQAETDLQRTAWLFEPEAAPPPFKDGTLSLFSAMGPSNECREILRRVIESKYSLDEVEVICPPGSAHAAVFYAASAKAGLKVSFAEGIPSGFFSAGKVLSGLLDWLENDYLTASLCRLIESGALKLHSLEAKGKPSTTAKGKLSSPAAERLSPTRTARYLRTAMIGWGRDRYLLRLKKLKESFEKKAQEAEKAGDSEKALRLRMDGSGILEIIKTIREFLKLIPAADAQGLVDLGLLCAGLSSLIKKYSRIQGDLDAKAQGALTARLGEAAAAAQTKVPWGEALEWLQGLIQGVRAGPSGPLPGHLFVSDLRTGGYSGRPVTFLVGLDQGVFPGVGLQDPVLLDGERREIAPGLPETGDVLQERLYAMASLVSSLRGRAILSYSAYDIIEERASFPSSLLLQAFRLIEGDVSLDYSDLLAAHTDTYGLLPADLDRVFDEIDWWLVRLAPGGRFLEGQAAVRAHFDDLNWGVLAQTARRSPFVNPYEGMVDIDPSEFCPCENPDIVMSATRLELLAKCPFGYFLRYVLGISKPDELEYDPSRWLDPLQRGTLLHDIMCHFMRRLKTEKVTAVEEKHRDLMRRIAEERIALMRDEVPPPSEGIFERECQELMESLQVFLRAEAQRTKPVEPVLFEAVFGLKEPKGEGTSEPVEISVKDKHRMSLGGRIDRVDRVGNHCYRVIDYKTGSYSPFEDMVCFKRGQALQHVLYSAAAEKILKDLGIDRSPKVVESGYSFPTKRGEGREILFRRELGAALPKLLDELLGIIRMGNFLVNPAVKCDFCDYKPLCGAAAQRSKERMGMNPWEYEVFARLKDFE